MITKSLYLNASRLIPRLTNMRTSCVTLSPLKILLKTDSARDFFNSTLGPYLLSNGIVHQSTCVDTPQQNGVVEHKNIHLLEVALSLLFTSNIPKRFWGEAVLTAT